LSKKEIKVTGYLTESKLGDVLKEIFGTENVRSQVKVPGTKMRVDFEFSYNGQVFQVEFDGDSHYRDIDVIFRDMVKGDTLPNLIRIPYWLQLNTDTFRALFTDGYGIDPEVSITTDFPHGFISKDCVFPASFCEMGISRFLREVYTISSEVLCGVRTSLLDRVREKKIPHKVVPAAVGEYLFNIPMRKHYDTMYSPYKRYIFIDAEALPSIRNDLLEMILLDRVDTVKEIGIDKVKAFTIQDLLEIIKELYGVKCIQDSNSNIIDITRTSDMVYLNFKTPLEILSKYCHKDCMYIRTESMFRTSILEIVEGSDYSHVSSILKMPEVIESTTQES